MTYSEKLQDPRWQKKRLKVMNRDKWLCLDCNESEKTLTVHHCRYSGEPWEIEDKFLMTLCMDCHKSRQDDENDAKMMVAQISSLMDQNEFHEFVGRLANVVCIKQSQKVTQ
jgi:5-methylcytosine-specific restriction endonuclease McrA